MPKIAKASKAPKAPKASAAADPIVLRWHAGGVSGALFDSDMSWHSGQELLDWASRGVAFVVLDHESGEDITRIFLAHWNASLTEVVDPGGSRRRPKR